MTTITPEEAIEIAEEAPPGGSVVVEVPRIEEIDIGDYCIDCRDFVGEGSKGFAARRPEVRLQDDGESAIKGFICENCLPLEGTLMEPLVEALVERRFDEKQIRDRMKTVGVEDIYEKVVSPTLDLLEVLLSLERR